MTGKQIAANLRASRRRWGIEALYNNVEKRYCVLGIKAAEAGVANSTLEWFAEESPIPYADLGVQEVYEINDVADTKQNLIKTFESDKYAKQKFPIERFTKYLLKAQKKLSKKSPR